ncbi:MAG TPA: alpha/beta fold hydrolase [Egibacteraceae bacterium]|nr:alpha/beta fold hydrolase [Egibacteraceae bacterium]
MTGGRARPDAAAPVAGAEAWAAGGGDVGILALHGFTGNPVSLRPLAEALAAAGFAVELPRLPGHGSRWQDLRGSTWRDWAGEAAAGLQRLGARSRAQVVVGLSMGGTLALHLAQSAGRQLAGLVLVNPWIHARDRRLKLLPLLKWVLPAVAGVGNDIAKPGADERAYPKIPPRAVASALELIEQVREEFAVVNVPTLVFTSRQDHVVDPDSSRIVLHGIASHDKQQVWLERSYHVATLDYDLPEIVERTAAFARRVAAAPTREI